MALTQGAVRVAGTGEVSMANSGATAPTNATSALDAAFKGLGYTDTDGVQFQLSRDTGQIDGWQGSKLRVVTNAEPITVSFKLLETRTDTLLAAFGGGTVGAYSFTPPTEGTNKERALVVHFDDDTLKYRWYFPKAQLEGDISFDLTRGAAVGYDVTFGILANTPRFQLFTNDSTYMLAGS